MPVERQRPPPAAFDTGHPGDDAQLEALAIEAHLVVPRRWTHFLYFTEEARAAVESLAAQHPGEYDGWRAWL